MAGSPAFQFGKLLLTLGLVLAGMGLLVMAGSRAGLLAWRPQGLPLRFGKLPGDISYQSKNVSFYFPLVTCLLLSAFATLILWLISLFRRP
jgi:Protein of unknown function (DUF2905)